MIAKRLMNSLMAASALALCAGGAHATVFTLNLSTSGGVFSNPDRYDAELTGFPTDPPADIFPGDEVIVNLSITGGAITLPAASNLQIFSFFLTGDGFPVGDSATLGTLTFFDGLTQVAQGPSDTTTSNGVASDTVLFAPTGALTFDSVTADFTIVQIGADHDTQISPPGVNGDLNSGHFSAETRNLTAAVPEPASWALMLLGFGGLGAALRRRRAQPALA